MKAIRLMPSETLVCNDVSALLAEFADNPGTLLEPASSHLKACLKCQAEMAQFRKLIRVMKTLRADLAEPGDDLLGDVLDLVRPPASVHRLHRSDRRKVYIGGIAAAATAGAAGAFVLATRVAGGRRLAS